MTLENNLHFVAGEDGGEGTASCTSFVTNDTCLHGGSHFLECLHRRRWQRDNLRLFLSAAGSDKWLKKKTQTNSTAQCVYFHLCVCLHKTHSGLDSCPRASPLAQGSKHSQHNGQNHTNSIMCYFKTYKTMNASESSYKTASVLKCQKITIHATVWDGTFHYWFKPLNYFWSNLLQFNYY